MPVISLLEKFKNLSSNKLLLGLILFFLITILSGGYFLFDNLSNKNGVESSKRTIVKSAQAKDTKDVLGHYRQEPSIYIYGGENSNYVAGGMIALASTDEPAVRVSGYDISGIADVTMYEANEDALIDYLIHDKDGKQIKKGPDLSKFTYVTNVKHDISKNSIPLPFKETGIWFIKVKIGKIEANAYVLRSNIGVLAEEGDNEFVFWGQNFKTKRSISEGSVSILNLLNGKKELQASSFNSDGIAKSSLNADADIALIRQNEDRAIVPINLKYLNTGYSSYKEFAPKQKSAKYFIFTDRPLYKPGDIIYFKSVLRDDDDARYSIPSGEASVRIYNDYYYEGSEVQPVFQRNFAISPDGTVSGQYQLPSSAKVGYYTLAVSSPNQGPRTDYSEWINNTASFSVQFFRKPEFFLDVTIPNAEFIAGDTTSFKITGQYFSGQPLNQKVKYTVYSADFYEYQYLTDQQYLSSDLNDDYRYGYWYGENKVAQGSVSLYKGEAKINLDTKVKFNKGKAQVFSIEATIEDGSQNPAFARRNILVYAGEFGIYRKDTSYGSKINTPLVLPVKLVPHQKQTNVSTVNLTAKIHRENWVAYQEENKKYPSYKKEEEDLPQVTATTDDQGNASIILNPKKIGYYTITVSGLDARGNNVAKTFYSYVSAEDQPYYTDGGNSDLTVASDKQKYLPNETARLNIFSSIPDRDVFLAFERGRVDRFQIVHINGKNATIEVPLINTDVPNMYARVASFSNYNLDSTDVNIPVSPEGKKVIVSISPNTKRYGPGETVTVDISTTDIGGNPISSELALWAVDKAIFELADNNLGNIFKTFWAERYNNTKEAHSLEGILVRQAEGGGGCFAEGTQVLMSDGKLKNIEEVKIGEYVLTRSEKEQKLIKARVTGTHKAEENGYLILNGAIRVTANHFMWVNNSWKEAGNIQQGDFLTDSLGKKVYIKSVEWQRGKYQVYNLEIENYHTYFAGGVWVHNQKGGGREIFKDTAYWNPAIHTDASGKAQISFKLPDNLTTWALAAVAATADTKVGQATNEIVVTKDVIVRPIVPNILRVGDEIVLSALVQNYTDKNQTFNVSLSFESGNISNPSQSLYISSESTEQFYWTVKPQKANEKAKLVFSAASKDNKKATDTIVQEIPVREFGFMEQRAQAGEGPFTYSLQLANDTLKEKSKVTLSLSPTLLGTFPTAMKYLINYPYGCVEQTTSRFVPAVIAKANQNLFTEALKDKDINDIIEKGVSKLSSQQQYNGGWTWWFEGKSDPFITAYVVEYLLEAKRLGTQVDNDMLKKATNYLEQDKYYDSTTNKDIYYPKEDLIARNYGLTLLGKKDKLKKITNLNNLGPDILAIAVMTNYLNGDKDANSNGLNKLIAMAKTQGNAVYWEEGNKLNFGSKDASTAFAIRAIILAGGERNLADKAARYLTRVRRYNYWSNTFATAQVIRALVDLSKTGDEQTPNYNYTVSLDGKRITQGNVTSAKQTIKDIEIPLTNLQDRSSVSIDKNGAGQVYSTLVINEFHTDRKARAVEHGLKVSREFVNEKGEQYTLAVGDTALVKVTVSGLGAEEYYGVINDELPSGLVPINQSFKNEQYNNNYNPYSSYDYYNGEITENGMVLSLYALDPGEHTYTYKARVVNEGTFIVPPATASLMYAPEIYGRSEVQTLQITKESKIIFKKSPRQAIAQFFIPILVGFIVVIGIIAFFMKKRGITIEQIKERIKNKIKRNNTQPPFTPENPIKGNG